MALAGSRLDQIHRVIVGAYTRDELRRTLRTCMDLSFDSIAPDKGFAAQIWALVEWADQTNQLLPLVRCVCEDRQGHADAASLWRDAQSWDLSHCDTPGDVDMSCQLHDSAVPAVSGSGAFAQQGGVAAGAGGAAIGGSVFGNISIHQVRNCP